jgi:hypothetical protein
MNTLLKLVISVLLTAAMARANTCISDSEQLIAGDPSTLPKEIGNPKATVAKTPFQMSCDTMYVRAGDTTTVYQGSLLHFPSDKFENRIVKVQGVLKLLGDEALPVFMAGSRKEAPIGTIPGDERWGGIHLDEMGALLVRHSDLVNADTALYLRSDRYALQEVRFEGCGVYVLPDRTINTLDKREYLNLTGADSTAFISRKPKAKHSKAPWIWGGAGVAVIGVVVAGVLMTADEDKGKPAKPEPESVPLDPDFPGKPDPR